MRDKIQEIVVKAVAETIDLTDAIDELLNLYSVSGCSTSQSDDLKEAEKIFEEEEGRKPNWNNSKDELVVCCMQVAISHVRNNR